MERARERQPESLDANENAGAGAGLRPPGEEPRPENGPCYFFRSSGVFVRFLAWYWLMVKVSRRHPVPSATTA